MTAELTSNPCARDLTGQAGRSQVLRTQPGSRSLSLGHVVSWPGTVSISAVLSPSLLAHRHFWSLDINWILHHRAQD